MPPNVIELAIMIAYGWPLFVIAGVLWVMAMIPMKSRKDER